jgi:hypothetical protein
MSAHQYRSPASRPTGQLRSPGLLLSHLSGYCWFPSIGSSPAHPPCAPFMPFYFSLSGGA